MHLLHSFTSVSALLLGSVLAVQPGDVKGLSFINPSNNQRIQIIGVDYQPGGQAAFDGNTGKDVLSDGDACLRDAVMMQQLGINTIRVYNVNPQTDHSLCMSTFNAAGIYVILDVNTPQVSLNRADPASSYNLDYLKYIFSQVENFKGYPNTLAFFAGNEVINDVPTAGANPPYIRAIQRDLRQYIAKHSSRHIPVGYSAADVRDVLQDTWAYLTCAINGDSNDVSRGELFGLNSYSWCGTTATFQSAGYDQLVSMFQSTSVPVFFSEYGCNKPLDQPRVFNEVQALYGPNMTTLNGGLVYEYTEETSRYGLVTLNSDGSINLLKDFDNLQSQFNKLDRSTITNVPSTNNNPVKCDASLITSSSFNKSFTLPAQPSGASDLINNGVSGAKPGKLVSVTNLNVKQKVVGSNGNTLSNLQLKVLDNSTSNLPNGANSSGGNSGNQTSSAGKGGSSSKSAASSLSAAGAQVAGGAMAAIAILFALF